MQKTQGWQYLIFLETIQTFIHQVMFSFSLNSSFRFSLNIKPSPFILWIQESPTFTGSYRTFLNNHRLHSPHCRPYYITQDFKIRLPDVWHFVAFRLHLMHRLFVFLMFSIVISVLSSGLNPVRTKEQDEFFKNNLIKYLSVFMYMKLEKLHFL